MGEIKYFQAMCLQVNSSKNLVFNKIGEIRLLFYVKHSKLYLKY